MALAVSAVFAAVAGVFSALRTRETPANI